MAKFRPLPIKSVATRVSGQRTRGKAGLGPTDPGRTGACEHIYPLTAPVCVARWMIKERRRKGKKRSGTEKQKYARKIERTSYRMRGLFCCLLFFCCASLGSDSLNFSTRARCSGVRLVGMRTLTVT